MTDFYRQLEPILACNALFRDAVVGIPAEAPITVCAIRDRFQQPQVVYGGNGHSKSRAIGTYPPDLPAMLHQRGFVEKQMLSVLLWERQPLAGAPAAKVVKVASHGVAAHFRTVYGDAFRGASPALTLQHAENCLASPYYTNFVVYADDRPCAVSSCAMANGIAGLYNIGCQPLYQGRGYGRAALQAALSVAAAAQTVFLESRTEPALLAWYERQGFTPLAHASVWQLLP